MTLTDLQKLVPVEGQRGVVKQITEFVKAASAPEFIRVECRGVIGLLLQSGALEYVHGARKHYDGFKNSRAQYAYAYYVATEDFHAAVASMPGGENAIRVTANNNRWTGPALSGELAVRVTSKLFDRYVFDRDGGMVWQHVGIATRVKDNDGESYWEHGKDAAEVEAERLHKIQRIVALYRERNATRKQERRARLVTRLCRNVMVSAEDVRAVGACMAGIQNWCASRGVDPAAKVSLTELARDGVAHRYALLIAHRVQHANG